MTTLAQIGCGYWGPNLLRNFSEQPDCHVKWVAEQSPQRCAFVEANYPQTKTTAHWQDVVDDPEVEGVIIATPASTHYQLAKASLKAGKHILVEKPLATSTQQVDELIALAAKTQRVLMVGHTFLYNSAVHYVKQFIDQGELGETYYIYSQRLNLGQVRSDVNVWWNLAPHDISILLYLMDNELPISVGMQGVDFIQSDIEDTVFAALTWANGVTAHIQLSWLHPLKVRGMTIVGSRRMIVYDDISKDKIRVFNQGIDQIPGVRNRTKVQNLNNGKASQDEEKVWQPQLDFQEPLKVEAAHFLDCIRTGQIPLTGPEHGRNVVRVLEIGDRLLQSQRMLQKSTQSDYFEYVEVA